MLPALAFVLAVLPFVGTLDGAFLDWDDQLLLLRNSRWHEDGWLSWILFDSSGGVLGPYQPLTWLSYRLDYALSGLDPLHFHATNVLLHGLTAAALLALVRRVLQTTVPDVCERPAACDVAALLITLAWAMHPLRVEAVAWITARRDVLSTLLVVLSLRVWWDYALAGGRRRYLGSLALFVLALLAKSAAMGLPLVLLVLDAWPLRRGVRDRIVEKLPFVAASIGVAAAAWAGQVETGALASVALFERPVLAGAAAFQLVADTVGPARLHAHYLRPDTGAILVPGLLVPAVAVGAVTGIAIGLRRSVPALAVAWLSYLLLLAPSSGLVPVGAHLTADRYAHMATLPLVLLIGGAACAGALRRDRLRAAGAAAAVVVVLLGVGSAGLARSWTDTRTLFERVVRLAPRDWLAHEVLGVLAERRDEPRVAIAHFAEAVRLHPSADARVRLAAASGAVGDVQRAEDELRSALAGDPAHARALYNLAVVLTRTGREEQAPPLLRRALAAAPDYTVARTLLMDLER